MSNSNTDTKTGSEIEEDPLATATTETETETATKKTRKRITFKEEKREENKIPEIEIKLYKQGKGPIAEFKTALGGWEQDQLEVREICEKYGFKSVYAFNHVSATRGVPIRFHPRNGRSLLTYKDGSVIYIDGEPKDSVIQPVTKIVIGVLVMTLLITLVVRDPPEWLKKFDISSGSIPPWVLACVVIVFTRMRKRTKDLLKKFGW